MMYRVSQKKKYGVSDYRYSKNAGNTQQCNIFRHKKYNFQIVVCKIATPNVTKDELEKNDAWVKRDL